MYAAAFWNTWVRGDQHHGPLKLSEFAVIIL